MAGIYNELGWSERIICGRTFMVPPPESAGIIPFDLFIPNPSSPSVDVPPLPTGCYDASFGRIHVQPHCRCPKVKGKRK